MERDVFDQIRDLRGKLLAKEEELNGKTSLLLEQDFDLRACLNRIGDLEKVMLANPPRCQRSGGNATASPASSEGRLQERIRDTRRRTASCDNVSAAPGAGGLGKEAKVVASTTTDCLLPSAAHPSQSVDVDTPPSSSPTTVSGGRCRQMQPQHFGDAADSINHEDKETPAGNESIWQDREVNLPPQQSWPAAGGSWAAHLRPASTTALNTAALAASLVRGACLPESPPQHAAMQRADLEEAGATSEKHHTSVNRRFEQQVVHEREQEDHNGGGSSKGSGRDDDSLSRAERRAEEAEAAKRLAKHEARIAKDEAGRLRREGAELSAWRDAVFDIRDALEKADKDGEGKSDSRGDVDCDPIARHRRWVSSSALGTLLPHLQQRAQELLSELAVAQARELMPTVSEAAPARVVHHQKEEREKASATSVASAADAERGGDEARETVSTLRKECDTLRIIVRALREKDDESERQITALQGEIFQASRAVVRQDAMVSALRRRIDADPYTCGGTTRSGGCGADSGNDEDVGILRTRIGKPARLVSMTTPPPTATRFPRASARRRKEVIVDPSLQSSKPWPLSNDNRIESSTLEKCRGLSECHRCSSSSPEAPGNYVAQAQGCRSVACHVPEPSNDRQNEGYTTWPNHDLGGRHGCESRCKCALGHVRDSRRGTVASMSRNDMKKRRGCDSCAKDLDRQINVDLRKKDTHVCDHIRSAKEMEASLSERSEHRSHYRRRLFVDEVSTPASSGDCIREHRNPATQYPGWVRRGKAKHRRSSLHGITHANSTKWHGALQTCAAAPVGNSGGDRAPCAEGTSALYRGRRRQENDEDILRQRLLQARRDLSALRNGVSTEELSI